MHVTVFLVTPSWLINYIHVYRLWAPLVNAALRHRGLVWVFGIYSVIQSFFLMYCSKILPLLLLPNWKV